MKSDNIKTALLDLLEAGEFDKTATLSRKDKKIYKRDKNVVELLAQYRAEEKDIPIIPLVMELRSIWTYRNLILTLLSEKYSE